MLLHDHDEECDEIDHQDRPEDRNVECLEEREEKSKQGCVGDAVPVRERNKKEASLLSLVGQISTASAPPPQNAPRTTHHAISVKLAYKIQTVRTVSKHFHYLGQDLQEPTSRVPGHLQETTIFATRLCGTLETSHEILAGL